MQPPLNSFPAPQSTAPHTKEHESRNTAFHPSRQRATAAPTPELLGVTNHETRLFIETRITAFKVCNKACLCGILCCIKFAHKGLQKLAEQDDARLLPQHLIRRIRRILTELAAAQSARDMELPGYRLHPLKGNRRGQWSVHVSGNWRMVFRFVDGEAVDVDLIDYH